MSRHAVTEVTTDHDAEVPSAIAELQRRLGLAVHLNRRAADLSQVELAEKVGTTQPALSALENGKNHRRINLDILQKIGIELGFPSLSAFIAFAENIPDKQETIRKAEAFVAKYASR